MMWELDVLKRQNEICILFCFFLFNEWDEDHHFNIFTVSHTFILNECKHTIQWFRVLFFFCFVSHFICNVSGIAFNRSRSHKHTKYSFIHSAYIQIKFNNNIFSPHIWQSRFKRSIALSISFSLSFALIAHAQSYTYTNILFFVVVIFT